MSDWRGWRSRLSGGARVAALLLGVLPLALAGCSSARYRPAPGAAPLAPFRGEVRVLERLPPPGSYRRLGVVVAEGGDLTSRERLLGRLKREAAARGADAIVVQRPAASPAGYSGSRLPRLAAWAIRLDRTAQPPGPGSAVDDAPGM